MVMVTGKGRLVGIGVGNDRSGGRGDSGRNGEEADAA